MTKLVAVVKTRICNVLIYKTNDRTDQKSQMQGQETVSVKMNQTC